MEKIKRGLLISTSIYVLCLIIMLSLFIYAFAKKDLDSLMIMFWFGLPVYIIHLVSFVPFCIYFVKYFLGKKKLNSGLIITTTTAAIVIYGIVNYLVFIKINS